MDQNKPRPTLTPSRRDRAAEYLFDMLAQLATLARNSGEVQVAIHLDAIIAARHATEKDPSP